MWRDKPRHDWASHGADAFRCLASRYREFEAPLPKPQPLEYAILQCGPGGAVQYAEGFSVLEWAEQRSPPQEIGEYYLTELRRGGNCNLRLPWHGAASNGTSGRASFRFPD